MIKSATAGLLSVLLLSIPVLPSQALAGSKGDGSGNFERFCQTWMGKLREREKANERSVRIERKGDLFVGEFTGYTSEPVECNARSTGKAASPYVGRLVYHEIRYGKEGSTAASARSGKARELYRVEVMELFRYDGSAWKY